MLLCVFLGPTHCIFHSYIYGTIFVLKVPLNTKQTNKQLYTTIRYTSRAGQGMAGGVGCAVLLIGLVTVH